jgi:hypothetical protein
VTSLTLAKRGTRQITVGSVDHRWKVRGRPTYCQGMGWSPLTFVVEQAGASGSLLVVSLPCAHPSNWLVLPSCSILPSTVTAAIALGLESGWHPSRPEPAFSLALDDSAIEASGLRTPK